MAELPQRRGLFMEKGPGRRSAVITKQRNSPCVHWTLLVHKTSGDLEQKTEAVCVDCQTELN